MPDTRVITNLEHSTVNIYLARQEKVAASITLYSWIPIGYTNTFHREN